MKRFRWILTFFIIGLLGITLSSPVFAGCTVTIIDRFACFEKSESTGKFDVEVSEPNCVWYATDNADWITITSGNGVYHYGNEPVEYIVASNPSGIQREGKIFIGSETHTILQSWPSCVYPIDCFAFFKESGGSGKFDVEVSEPNYVWYATDNADWITITSGSDGYHTGNEPVAYTVTLNSSEAPREGKIFIECETHTILQAGPGYSCPISPKVVGYFPRWEDLSKIKYDKLTHINYSFLYPTSNGGLEWTTDNTLRDDFDDETYADKWTIYHNDGTITESGTTLHVNVHKPANDCDCAVLDSKKKFSGENLIFETRVKPDGYGGVYLCVKKDSSNIVRFGFNTDDEEYVEFGIFEDGAYDYQHIESSTPYLGTYNTIKIVKTGKDYEAFLNGIKKGTTIDGSALGDSDLIIELYNQTCQLKSGDSDNIFDYVSAPNFINALNSTEEEKLTNLAVKAKNKGVKVLIAVGGWFIGDGGGNDTRFVDLSGETAYRVAFANNLVDFINTYGLDGVDIDWEYPDSSDQSNNFEKLMKELHITTQDPTKFNDNKVKLLTAAVPPDKYYGQWVNSGVSSYVDFINIMAYDKTADNHSPCTYAVEAFNYWSKTKCFPKEQLIIGVPFYGRNNQTTPPSFKTYAKIIEENPALDPDTNKVGDYYFNGINTVKNKTLFAIHKAAGVMIWSIDQDSFAKKSLLDAIDMVINRRSMPWIPLLLLYD